MHLSKTNEFDCIRFALHFNYGHHFINKPVGSVQGGGPDHQLHRCEDGR